VTACLEQKLQNYFLRLFCFLSSHKTHRVSAAALITDLSFQTDTCLYCQITDTKLLHRAVRLLVGCLHYPANVQQTSSISTRILNTFTGSLLDVCLIV